MRIRALLPLLVVLLWLPAASADVLWQPYQSSLDGFGILFPGKPEKTDKDFGNGAIFHQFLVDSGDTAFMVLYTQYAPGTFVGKDAKLILDKSKESLLAGQKATVRVDRPFMFGTTPAREFIIDDEHGSTQVYRFYLVLDRLYQVICGGPKGFETSQEAQRFQNSFRLIAH
ncbi:MAG TPA: hypothetical protein VMU85_11280 [Stellaceae bacterium]|nr:hypothetical protein [Stellaceae bacterium]